MRFGPGMLALVVLALALVGLASASVAFAATSTPVVSKLSAASGPPAGGNSITITGKNFMSGGKNAVKKVLFGSKAATHVHVVSASKLTVKAPSHAAGTVQVRVVSKASATSAKGKADRYTYLLPLPTITLLNPMSGPMAGGTSVTITGTHLADATAVTFGGLPATITADSATQITTTSPFYSALVNANTTIFVMVQTAAGTTDPTMVNQYTFTIPTTASGAPAVTGVSPNEGPAAGGTAVTITGSGFTGATEVDFNTGILATNVTVVSSTEITCVAPAGAGTVDVTVTTLKGTSGDVTNDWFTYES
jgi:hypothetical protein